MKVQFRVKRKGFFKFNKLFELNVSSEDLILFLAEQTNEYLVKKAFDYAERHFSNTINCTVEKFGDNKW